MKFDKYIRNAIILVILINLVDLSLTIYCLENNLGYEVNPVSNYFFNNFGYLFVLSFNILYISLMVFVSFKAGEVSTKYIEKRNYNDKIRKKHFKTIVISLYLIESLVILNNIYVSLT